MPVAAQKITDTYAIYLGDAMEVMPELPAASIHLSVYSPPFATSGGGLYHYSSSDRDLSNARSYNEFFTMYGFFVREMARVTMPGRCSAVHCMDVPVRNHDSGAFIDFPGDIIRLHQASGFAYVGRHAIWKSPLKVRNVTLAKGLVHRTVTEDAASATLAAADYLLIFRRDGGNPAPVTHPCGFTEYCGWSHAARKLGLRDVGIELDAAACRTRAAAGHRTIRADVAGFGPGRLAGRVHGLAASPPCTTFSESGDQAGSECAALLSELVGDALARRDTRSAHRAAMSRYLTASGWKADARDRDARIRSAAASAALVAEPARFIAECRPEWVVLEQVPSVLPLWDVYARTLAAAGYSAWAAASLTRPTTGCLSGVCGPS